MIRIVIIDNQEECRTYLCKYLSQQKDFKIVGSGSGAYEAVRLTETNKPDVILMDNIQPPGDEIKAALLIKARYPRTAVIINSDDESRILMGFFSGISGYVTKKINPELLSHAIRTVYNGGCLIATEMVAALFDNAVKLAAAIQVKNELYNTAFNTAVAKLPGNISPFEMELMSYVGQGYTNKEIAEKLCRSEGTIRNRISTVLQKTGLHDRTQVAIYAVKAGL